MRSQALVAAFPLTAFLLIAGCSSSGTEPVSSGPAATSSPTTQPPRNQPVNSQPRTAVPPPDPTSAVEGGFGSDETFCAAGPAAGRIRYDVTRHQATLDLHVARLPKRADLGVGWHNAHTPRDYIIASFETNRYGHPRRPSLRMFRPGETRGSGMVLVTRSDRAVARLRPCRRHHS
jgi:hypothetical protein